MGKCTVCLFEHSVDWTGRVGGGLDLYMLDLSTLSTEKEEECCCKIQMAACIDRERTSKAKASVQVYMQTHFFSLEPERLFPVECMIVRILRLALLRWCQYKGLYR